MKPLYIILLLIIANVNLHAQNPWVTVDPSNGYFTFQMPGQPVIYDTLNLEFYTYSVDTDIVMQVYYFDADTAFGDNTSDSIDNPLLAFVAQLLYSQNGTLSSINDVDFTGQTVRAILAGKEFGITYPISESNEQYLFTRVYHDGQSILAFYISAPDARISDLISFKNLFFQNINILN